MTQTNRKPPDELADVREKIRELKAREDVLREMLIAGEVELMGDEFLASVVVRPSERLDTAKMRKEMDPKVLEPFLVVSKTTTVKVDRVRGGED